MTATVFSTQIAVLPMEALMVQAKAELEQKLEIPFTAGFGGVTATIGRFERCICRAWIPFKEPEPIPAWSGKWLNSSIVSSVWP